MDKNAVDLIYVESNFTAGETVQRVKDILKEMSIPLFAEFDHAKNAAEVDMHLRPTTVLVFGSPAAGTQLMLKNQAVAIELPLKILVWQDEDDSVKIAYINPQVIAKDYNLEGQPVIAAMMSMLENISVKAAGAKVSPQ